MIKMPENDCLKQIVSGGKKIAIIGLGYVGLPLACAFGKKVSIIGFDIDSLKIAQLRQGLDVTGEIRKSELTSSDIEFTNNSELLRTASFYIIAVPTPIDENEQPDLSPLISASRILAKYLRKGDIVVFESTVYPGVTEDVCGKILEQNSGLICGADFFLGYSPERINPGDKSHTVEKILKIVSGQNNTICDVIAGVYEMIVEAGIYKAESIKVAEAAKVIENTQRDINIALMNEFSMIFSKMNIDTKEVLAAAGTKWNFHHFTPGLVGGHCIGVDPYYLTHKAEELGYRPQMILAGRRINGSMGKYVAENTVKCLIKAHRCVEGANVLIMGLTFKENISDSRNSQVKDVLNELSEYNMNLIPYDPCIDPEGCRRYVGVVPVSSIFGLDPIDAIIITTNHDAFKKIRLDTLKSLFSDGIPVLLDIKWLFDRKEASEKGFLYWRL